MKILVIGGTYFLGKAFVKQACKGSEYDGNKPYEQNQLYLLNRGSRPLSPGDDRNGNSEVFPIIKEYHMDRHDIDGVRKIPEKEFDVVVDFCAYSRDDIRSVVDAFGGAIGQYIFISTCDVYRRGTGSVTDESGELEDRNFGGEAGEYIAGKVALEKELISCCKEYDIRYTSIRPAFIYGPDNYAPREGIFFNWIEQAGQIIFPEDSDGKFQMVYVDDLAKIILAACKNPLSYDKAYNVCGDGYLSYEIFAGILKKATGVDFEKVNLSVKDIQAKNIALPFPLTKDETELYCGEQVRELGVNYTPIEQGMKKAYEFFINFSKS